MDRVYRIYAPINDNSGNPIDDHLYDKYLERISDIFGGATLYNNVKGCWKDEDRNQIQCEPVRVIEIVRDVSKESPSPEHDAKAINEIVKNIGTEMGQWGMLHVQQECNAEMTMCEWRPSPIEGYIPSYDDENLDL